MIIILQEGKKKGLKSSFMSTYFIYLFLVHCLWRLLSRNLKLTFFPITLATKVFAQGKNQTFHSSFVKGISSHVPNFLTHLGIHYYKKILHLLRQKFLTIKNKKKSQQTHLWQLRQPQITQLQSFVAKNGLSAATKDKANEKNYSL